MKILSFGDRIAPGEYRAHSRFAHAANFARGAAFLALADKTVCAGPLAVIVDDMGPVLRAERVGVSGNNSISMDGAVLAAPPLAVYNSSLQFLAGSKIDAGAVNALAAALLETAPEESFVFLLRAGAGQKTGFRGELEARVTAGAGELLNGKFRAGALKLRGAGAGLTPSGDDFLAGFLSGLCALEISRGKLLNSERQSVYAAALGQNIISNAFLGCAAEGNVSAGLRGFIAAAFGAGPGPRAAAESACRVGSTSGADTAVGFLFALKYGGFSW